MIAFFVLIIYGFSFWAINSIHIDLTIGDHYGNLYDHKSIPRNLLYEIFWEVAWIDLLLAIVGFFAIVFVIYLYTR